jgi:hypothetical protein
MSSRGIIAGLLLMVSQLAAAADWGTFALKSDHNDDPVILEAMDTQDFDTKILLCQGVGRRDDPFAGDIIDSLLARHTGAESYRAELLVRVLMQGLFDPARGEAALRARVAANRRVLAEMTGRIDRWKDPQLTAALVRVLPLMEARDALPPLMEVASRLVAELREDRGIIVSQDIALAMDFLSAVEKVPGRDFLEPCIAISRLSREKVLVDRARGVVNVILAR